MDLTSEGEAFSKERREINAEQLRIFGRNLSRLL